MNPLKAGDIAPKFRLPDQDGEQVNLTDFQGQRVLVYFYPKAMTPGCTVQACGLRDNMDELKKVGVRLFRFVPLCQTRRMCSLSPITVSALFSRALTLQFVHSYLQMTK